MKNTTGTEDLIKRYLLGELLVAEQVALEREHFVDQAKYARLCEIEDELIDQYLCGHLSPADRDRFVQCYLTNPRRQRRVKFAKALDRVVDENSAARTDAQRTTDEPQAERLRANHLWWLQPFDLFRTRRLVLRPGLIAAVLLIGSGLIWFVIADLQLRAELAEVRQENHRQQQLVQAQARQLAVMDSQTRQLTEERRSLHAQLQAGEITKAPSSRSASSAVSFALSIQPFRAAEQETQELIIPRNIADVQLRLSLPEHDDFKSYRVKLLTIDNVAIFSKKGLKLLPTRSGNLLLVKLPAHRLASRDYILAISGLNAFSEISNLGDTLIRVKKL